MSLKRLIPSLRGLSPADRIPHYINGRFIYPLGNSLTTVYNPVNKNQLGNIIVDDTFGCGHAIRNSQEVYQEWSKTSINHRIEKIMDWYQWLKNNRDHLATIISEENGKPVADASAEVERGLEVVKYALSAPSLLKGDYAQINQELEIHTKREPLGVTSGILPFNFPAMIPLWMIPLAVVTGNTVVLKTSEKCPWTPLYLAYGATMAGFPNGLINVIHGGQEVSSKLISDPDVKAVSFVGSTQAGKLVYDQATKHGKRTQINMGAKNHAVVMPDCHYQETANSIISAFVMGQRCMAISVLVVVDGAEEILDYLKQGLQSVEVERDMGPLIDLEAKKLAINSLQRSVDMGAHLLYGGDHPSFADNTTNYLGPVIIDKVTPEMEVYQDELFAPILAVIRVPDLDSAIKLVNQNQYGNGTTIFTTSNHHAHKYSSGTNVTQCGINVPIPVSPPYFSWTSSKESYRGSHYIYGPSSFDFYSQLKTIMGKYNSGGEGGGDGAGVGNISTQMPTHN